MPASETGAPAVASAWVSGVSGTSGRFHVVGGDFLDLVDGFGDDVQIALQTGDFLVRECDSGQIAQMHDFFFGESRHDPNSNASV